MARKKQPLLAERMLEAAGRLFGTQRFHEVRMEDVAAEASVSKGTLYRYFRDKEEMYLALLTRATEQMLQRLHTATEAARGARARLVALVQAVVVFFDEQPHVFALILRAEMLQMQGAPFPWQEVRNEGLRLVMEIFAQARRDGEFVIRHPALAALMFLGGLRAVVRFGEKPRPPRLAQTLVKDLLRGFATAAPAARSRKKTRTGRR